MLADIGILFCLLLLNGFFAMAELAIVSVRRTRLKQLAESGSRKAEQALELAENPTLFLSIVQIGVTLNSVLAGAYSGATLAIPLANYLERISILSPAANYLALGITVVGVTYLNLVIGELLPKRIGLAYADAISTRVAPIMRFLAFLAAPIVWLLRVSTDGLLYLFRLHNPPAISVTEEEVKDLIAEGTETGVFKPAEKKMIEGVMRLADRTVRTIMTPRVDMVWLDENDSVKELVRLVNEYKYSRLPVAKGDLEDVIGIVNAKDFLDGLLKGKPIDIKSAVQEVPKIPDSTPVLRLLDQFKQSGQHLAIVMDEYGSVEGLVTLTDVMEAIIGDLPEFGQETEEKPVRREDGSWLVDGMTPIDEIESLIGLKNMREGEEFSTIAGFFIDKLGRLPNAGDYIVWNDVRFEVVDMDGYRVDKILINPPKPSE